LSHRWARWLDERVVRIFLQQSSLILTNSKFTYQRVLSLGMNPRKATAIYCGYDGDLRIRSAEVPESGINQQHILFVGQCVECKGIEFLLRAMPMIPGQVALDIVGNTTAEPGYFIKLQHLVKTLGLASQVIFHGHVSDKTVLAQFYQRTNVFVLPSLVEGFGIVLLDAMSFGLPIVATRVGAIPELVQDGVNGLLVPPADPAALAEAIRRVLDSPALQEQYGRAGYNYIAERREFYSWEAVGQRALSAMSPLLEKTLL
jgi:glycosyltransferase involved in cell wall biosynthesis